MEKLHLAFAQRLREAMIRAGYEPRPAVLEREFNQRYWGRPMTLHGVRRWLQGETLPTQNKLLTLAEWLVENLAVEGVHVPVTQVRRLLPPLMGRLFGSRLSCSVKDKDGRVVRGYRGLALREVPEEIPAQP